MNRIKLFDCDMCLGVSHDPITSKVSTVSGIIDAMSHYQIDKALIYHKEAINSPYNGNKMLIEEIIGLPALYGCAVLTPSYGGEFGDISVYFDYLIESNIKAVRLFPRVHNYNPKPFYIDTIINEAQRCKMAVIIDEIDFDNHFIPVSTWGVSPSFDDIYILSQTYPKVDFIIISPGMLTLRKQLTILQKTNNVYFDCSSFGYKNIEYICGICSAEKLLFSTGFPVLEPGATISYIMYADISRQEKIKIAYDNLSNILGL